MVDIQIVQFNPVTGVATMTLGNTPKIISGMDELKQIVVLEYWRDPGQSVLNPNEGSGLRADIGQYGSGSQAELQALFVQRTQFIEKKILNRQSPGVGTPASRLLSLTILAVAVSADLTAIAGSVQITNEAGDSTSILM